MSRKIWGRFKIGIIAAVFSLSGFFGLAFFAMAALTNPLISGSFATLITNITKIVAQIGGPLAIMAIIWAGFLFVTARGNEEQVNKAKKTFLWAVIGATLIIGAKVLADAVAEFITKL